MGNKSKLDIIQSYGYESISEWEMRWEELKEIHYKSLRSTALWILSIEKEITKATGEVFGS